MAKSRKFLTAGAIGVAAIALIGAGASATFTSDTTSSQTITAGTMGVVVSSPLALYGCTTPAAGCTSITLPAVGPVNSTFETATHRVTITNNSNIPVMEKEMNLSDDHSSSTASAWLRAQMNVCVKSSDSFTNPLWVVANGPLTTGESLSPSVGMGQDSSLALPANGGQDFYDVSFYAGKDSACGHVTSAGSFTAHAWGVPAEVLPGGGDETFYTTPLSLTNEAMGGSVTPKITFNYTG